MLLAVLFADAADYLWRFATFAGRGALAKITLRLGVLRGVPAEMGGGRERVIAMLGGRNRAGVVELFEWIVVMGLSAHEFSVAGASAGSAVFSIRLGLTGSSPKSAAPYS